MNVFITGASGFIGTKISLKLMAHSDVVLYGLTRHQLQDHDRIYYIQGDILNEELVSNIFKKTKFDVVLHLAAITEHDAIVNHKQETFNANLQGTINLMNAFNKYCDKALFVFFSTGKVYGKTNEMPISENALTNPTNILGKSKLITEEVIDFFAQENNQYLICRIFNIYGEHQKRNFILPTIIDQLAGEKIFLGNTRDYRDYLYVDDMVDAILACIASRDEFSQVDYVNIGSGQPTSVKDMIGIIENITGRKLNVSIEDSRIRKDETFVEYCDNTKLKELTGWHEKYTLESGIRKSLKEEGIL